MTGQQSIRAERMPDLENSDELKAQDSNSDGALTKAPEERLLKQSEVDKIIHARTRDAYEKGRRESAAESAQPIQRPEQSVSSMGGMPQLTMDQIRQVIAEENQKRVTEESQARQREMAHQMSSSFLMKLEAGKNKYDPEDFDKTIGRLELGNTAAVNLIPLAHEANVDNVADVMYHLGNNPGKAAELITTYAYNPKWAASEMLKLSNSLKQNELARQYPKVSEPLSSVKASTIGTDTGKLSMKERARQPWARG